jgi:hypothetical protein
MADEWASVVKDVTVLHEFVAFSLTCSFRWVTSDNVKDYLYVAFQGVKVN